MFNRAALTSSFFKVEACYSQVRAVEWALGGFYLSNFDKNPGQFWCWSWLIAPVQKPLSSDNERTLEEPLSSNFHLLWSSRVKTFWFYRAFNVKDCHDHPRELSKILDYFRFGTCSSLRKPFMRLVFVLYDGHDTWLEFTTEITLFKNASSSII